MSANKPKTILVIDDEPGVVNILRLYLERDGYRVLSEDDGDKGLKTAMSVKPDLIVLDINLPHKSGLEFFNELQIEGGKTMFPILVLTGRGEFKELFKDLKADGFIAKPVNFTAFSQEIKRILCRHDEASLEKIARRILVAEDNDDMLAQILFCFSKAGLIVSSVSAGPELLDRANVEKPNLILIKLSMKGMAGDEVITELHQLPELSNIPILLYVPKSDELEFEVVKNFCRKAHISVEDFLRTDDPAELLMAVKRILKFS